MIGSSSGVIVSNLVLIVRYTSFPAFVLNLPILVLLDPIPSVVTPTANFSVGCVIIAGHAGFRGGSEAKVMLRSITLKRNLLSSNLMSLPVL